jgi:DNA polymerase-3 subunit alpha
MWNTRGSAGGSLVIYLFGISITDPIKHGLPFERFLTLGRIKSGTLPDVDWDCPEKDPVLEYLREKYGDKVALIATDVMMRLKTSILDAERAQNGTVSATTSKMCVKIKGADQGQTDKDWLFGYTDKTTGAHVPGFWEDSENPTAKELRDYANANPQIWKMVQKCLGVTKTRGLHAGGIVITPGPVHDYMPLVHSKKGLCSAYTMKGVEEVGGVKYDFLGVKTLKALGIAMQSIQEHENVKLEWEEFPHDNDVYDYVLLADLLAAVFQLNTETVRPFAAKMKPRSVLEIAILTALVRPGGLGAPSPDPSDSDSISAVDYYIMCKNGQKEPYYIHPDLEPILGPTFGAIVFQEQALEIFREIGGYTFEQAEVARRGIGKKIKELLEKCTGDLREACLKKGWTNDQAQRLIESIMASARYAFNKAHAVSYAIVAYNCCYLKHFYPNHFWKGIMTIFSEKHDKLRACLSECRHVLKPVDIEKSDPEEWLIDGDGLRPPLMLLKGCGATGVEKLKNFLQMPIKEVEGEG